MSYFVGYTRAKTNRLTNKGGVHPDHMHDVLCGTMLLKLPDFPNSQLKTFLHGTSVPMLGNEQCSICCKKSRALNNIVSDKKEEYRKEMALIYIYSYFIYTATTSEHI